MKNIKWYKVLISPNPYRSIVVYERNISIIVRERINIQHASTLLGNNHISVKHTKHKLISDTLTCRTYRLIYENILFFEKVEDAEKYFDIEGDDSIIENITDLIDD